MLTPDDPPAVSLPPGDGPRHFHFHPNGRWFYSIQEESSTIALFDYDAPTGRLFSRQTISTCRPDLPAATFARRSWFPPMAGSSTRATGCTTASRIFSVGPDGTLTYRRRRMDARGLSAQLQLRPRRPVPLLLQSASRQHRRVPGRSQDRRPRLHRPLRARSAIRR